MNTSQRISAALLVTATAGSLILGTAAVASASEGPDVGRTAAVVESATGAEAVARVPGEGVSVPPDAAGTVKARTAEGGSVSISLPQTKNVPGTKAGKGTTVYPGAAPSTDLAVQPTPEGGVRALAVLKDKTAPSEQRYTLALPNGAVLVKTDTGAVVAVAQDGKALGAFDAPWAKDANGKPVPTSYRIDGSTLVQSVRTTDSTAFPVVADPKWLDEAAKGATAGMIGGCVGGAIAGGAGCLPGAVATGVAGGVAGAISGLLS